MAQRMEAAAPPSGVMLTPRRHGWFADDVVLGDAELVAIKGSAVPVQARRLLGVADRRMVHAARSTWWVGVGSWTPPPVCWSEAIAGRGAVLVWWVPGIGKSRLTAELKCGGPPLSWGGGVRHLLRVPCRRYRVRCGGAVVADDHRCRQLDAAAARCWIGPLPRCRSGIWFSSDDLLGVADPAVPVPVIDPDARREAPDRAGQFTVAGGPSRRSMCWRMRTGSTVPVKRCWPVPDGDRSDPRRW